MQVFTNYPQTEEGAEILLNNLAIFKSELLLRRIEKLNIDDKSKEEVLKKVFELLDDEPENSVI